MIRNDSYSSISRVEATPRKIRFESDTQIKSVRLSIVGVRPSREARGGTGCRGVCRAVPHFFIKYEVVPPVPPSTNHAERMCLARLFQGSGQASGLPDVY